MTRPSFDDLLVRANRGYDWMTSDEGKRLDLDVSQINVDTLDMVQGHSCALSQASGLNYERMMDRLDEENYPVVTSDDHINVYIDDLERTMCLAPVWEQHHGFNLTKGAGNIEERSILFAELTEAWRQVIKERREEATHFSPASA